MWWFWIKSFTPLGHLRTDSNQQEKQDTSVLWKHSTETPEKERNKQR